MFFRTKLYARVTIGDIEGTRKETPTDKSHETNPEWNHTMEYTIADSVIQDPAGLNLLIELYLNRTRGDKRVSYVSRTIYELFGLGANNMGEGNITRLNLPLESDGGVTKGVVTFEYIFGEEKSVEKLSLVKKLVNLGISVAVKGGIMCMTTIPLIPIPIRVFQEPEIVCSKTGGGILSGDALVDVLVDGVQYIF